MCANAVAQRLQAALELQTLLIGRAQLRRQAVVQAALRAQGLLARQFQGQRGLQAGLGRSVVERGHLLRQLRASLGVGGGLL